MRTEREPRSGRTRLLLLLLLAIVGVLSACSGVPNLDAGSAGCQNARGIGPTPDAGGVPKAAPIHQGVVPELHGKTPAEAAALGAAAGHTVVFNVNGQCWCVAPPGGTINDSWFGQHGALWLQVEGFETDQQGDPPFMGWGC